MSEWNLEGQIEILQNAVDLDSFQPRAPLPRRPARALVATRGPQKTRSLDDHAACDVAAALQRDPCLAHAERHPIDRYVFLGDLVGYGADPSFVVDTVKELATRGAIALLGNHDSAAIGMPERMNDDAMAAADGRGGSSRRISRHF